MQYNHFLRFFVDDSYAHSPHGRYYDKCDSQDKHFLLPLFPQFRGFFLIFTSKQIHLNFSSAHSLYFWEKIDPKLEGLDSCLRFLTEFLTFASLPSLFHWYFHYYFVQELLFCFDKFILLQLAESYFRLFLFLLLPFWFEHDLVVLIQLFLFIQYLALLCIQEHFLHEVLKVEASLVA